MTNYFAYITNRVYTTYSLVLLNPFSGQWDFPLHYIDRQPVEDSIISDFGFVPINESVAIDTRNCSSKCVSLVTRMHMRGSHIG